MKKLLMTTSILGTLVTTSTTERLNTNQPNIATELLNQSNEEQECNYVWRDVNISHYVETRAMGTDEINDTKNANKGSAKSWDNVFINSKFIIVEGYFALHTYRAPEYLKAMLLVLNSKKSSNNLQVWESEQKNEAWSGTGHQSSIIKLKVITAYDSEENITNMEIESYIWARTAGSAHVCSTTSQINTIKFVIN